MSGVRSEGPAHPRRAAPLRVADAVPGAGQRLVVVGQGRIGLPLALRAAAAGYDVVGFDRRASRVRRLAAGEPHLPGVSRDALAQALHCGRYTVTARAEDCAGFDTAVITEPTPLRRGAPDLSAIDTTLVESSAVLLAPLMTSGSLVILETTTYPGTTEQLLVPTLELISGLHAGAGFSVGYSPERADVDGGTPWSDRPARPVAGIDCRSAERTGEFYASIGEDTVAVPEIRNAELAKLTEMTLQHGTPAMVEWLALLVAELGLGLDFWAMIERALPGLSGEPGLGEAGSGPARPGPQDHHLDAGSSADVARRPNPFDGAATVSGYAGRLCPPAAGPPVTPTGPAARPGSAPATPRASAPPCRYLGRPRAFR